MNEKLPTHPTELPPEERFQINPQDFPKLSQQREANGDTMNINKIAEKYLQSTAEMIAIMDGSAADPTGETIKPDYVIYLDKSARPVSWLVNIFWKDLAAADPARPGEKVPRPPHSYLNIDRVNWFRRTGTEIDALGNGYRHDGTHGRLGFSDFDQSKITKEDLAGLRALFIEGGVDTTNPDEIMQLPTKLDGKNILIIDEVKNSGSTLSIAQLLIKRAIPEVSSTRGDYFWQSDGTKMVGDEIQMGSVPIWYDASTEYGRGIGDINEAYHEKTYQAHPNKSTLARKLGAHVIGAPLGIDHQARQLMTEIRKLEEAYQEGHVLLAPPMNYGFERSIDIITQQGFQPDATGRFSSYANFRESRNKEKPAR
ncbi:MAG: hypothetical protein LBT19_02200 [Candidatus Nomurabacteria bacterium]|jgi:hypothetical protein|nr:hypothetical protein [Candidatus Nomurabacteria bacterium]